MSHDMQAFPCEKGYNGPIGTYLYCDDSPQFRSRRFQDFNQNYKFSHLTSYPVSHSSSGFIEFMAQTRKHSLIKLLDSNSDPQLAMLIYRSTPLNDRQQYSVVLLSGWMLFTRNYLNNSFETDHGSSVDTRLSQVNVTRTQHMTFLNWLYTSVSRYNPIHSLTTLDWELARITAKPTT